MSCKREWAWLCAAAPDDLPAAEQAAPSGATGTETDQMPAPNQAEAAAELVNGEPGQLPNGMEAGPPGATSSELVQLPVPGEAGAPAGADAVQGNATGNAVDLPSLWAKSENCLWSPGRVGCARAAGSFPIFMVLCPLHVPVLRLPSCLAALDASRLS